MSLQRRAYNSLPQYLQTDRNNLELAVADDLLYEPEQAKFVSGYIGDTSKLSSQDLARTPLIVENSAIQQKYQLSVGVAQTDPITGNQISGCFYDDLVNHLMLNGAITTDPNRIFSAYYYAWSPPIDYDKIVNPARYFWTGHGTETTNGEYITKEAAGTQVVVYQFNGTSLVKNIVTTVNGLPGSGSSGEIVEDVSTTDRFMYQWDSVADTWVILSFLVADDTTVLPSYFLDDFVYVCPTGQDYNRPVMWVYRTSIGRWVSVPIVISAERPQLPLVGMLWEDATVSPSRAIRIWDGNQWQLVDNGTIDPISGTVITLTRVEGPSGLPPSATVFLYDTRPISAVDSWSANNWWRTYDDLSLVDRGALASDSQGSRPIIEFWGNIETASGDTRTQRNQFPLFNLYAVSNSTFEIEKITTSNFPGLDTTALTASGNYIGGVVVSTIFEYEKLITGSRDTVLGFVVKYGTDGTPLFDLDLETLSITISGVALSGYRYYKDTATGFVHTIWERTGKVLTQIVDSNGLYTIPMNLQYNPDHIITTEVSRTDYIDHFSAVIGAQKDFSGTPYGQNNYRYTAKDLTLDASMIDPEESLQRVMSVLQTNKIDIPDAIRQMSRDYNKIMIRFVNQLNNYWNDSTLSTPTDTLTVTTDQAVDAILTNLFMGRNSEFPYYYSVMGTYVVTRIIGGVVYIYDSTPQPIYIPNSAVQIGASPPFIPAIFTDNDGISKIRGHDGSLIPAFGDARDSVILNLENRFFTSIQSYMKTETSTFSGRFSSIFHIDDYYGNFIPNLTAGTVVNIVADYTSIISPVAGDRLYSSATQVYATWDGAKWLTISASTDDVFFNNNDSHYYHFNGFFATSIPTWNRSFTFDYSENEYRQVIQREFERWIVVHDLDFITNVDYDPDNIFTWNFSSAGVEGNYRGIYRRIYNTIRPHSHPWEVIGYSVRPDWWFTSYVPTSYAVDGTPRYANTHHMWTNFQSGIVNPISGKIVDAEILVAPIPVDINGELLDPITAGVIAEQSLTPSSLGDDWAYGDGSPVEQSFYDSYYYQFAAALAGYLMKNTLFVDRTWSEYYRQIGTTGSNLLWNAPHIVYNTTLTRPQAAVVPTQLSLDTSGNLVQNPGLNAWIAEYTAIIGLSPDKDFSNAIKYSSAALGWKTSGFINGNRTRIQLLNGDEIPSDDINVVFHQGPSVNEYFNSGIVIVRDTDGFRVFGTDVLNPYFSVDLGAKPITGGSVESIEKFTYDGTNLHPTSDPTISYNRSAITVSLITIPPVTNDTAIFSVLINGYRAPDKFIQRIDSTTFGIDQVVKLVSGDNITVTVLTTASNPSTQLGSFTINNVQVTYFASGTGQIVNYPYGYLFETLSDVVNMMIGYGRYLQSQGWIFERLTNGVLRDWLGAAQTFVLWSTNLTIQYNGNPELIKGNIFEYSVMGRQAQFSAPFGMILGVEDIRNGSYGIVDVNGAPIRKNNVNVITVGGDITVTTDNTDIFGLRLYLSEVQHVVFFPNVTTFGDIIYEPTLGLVQSTLFVDTYRTTNWTGRMEAPGFLINGGNLYPNWEKQTNDITRLYDRFNPVDDPILLGMARALFGYVPKSYMDSLAIDDRNKFNFFHGSLKVKGTFQPYKAFIRGTTLGSDNVLIFEDWAWKYVRFGDARIVKVLFSVNEADFVDTFQVIHFDNGINIENDDRIIHIPEFSPPSADNRWVITPQESLYRTLPSDTPLPYSFPTSFPPRFPAYNGKITVDYIHYIYYGAIVDQTGQSPAISLFHWNPALNLHEPLALGLVDYKTAYDPAHYNAGPRAETANGLLWGDQQVGNVWWDTSVLAYDAYETDLPDYMKVSRAWGKLKYFNATIVLDSDTAIVTTLDPRTGLPTAHQLTNGQVVLISGADQPPYNGSISVTVSSNTTFTFVINVVADSPATGDIVVQLGLVNCYEWVASPVPPITWVTYVNSQSGFDTYTGVVYNEANVSYATKEVWDVDGNSSTIYYFWVKNNTRIIPQKNLSVNDIAGRLKNPVDYEVPFFAIMDPSTIFVFPGDDVVLDGGAIELSYSWYEMPRHIEWLLIGENNDFNTIPTFVTDKLLDSLLGVDIHNNPVPNVTLAPIDIYGTCFFPAQTVFQNINDALAIYLDAVNNLVVNIDVNIISQVFNILLLSDEKTDSQPNGYWERATYWLSGIDHSIIYDSDITTAERDFLASAGYYYNGDIIRLVDSGQTDPWDSSDVAAYYQYQSGSWNLVGIDHHTFTINDNILNSAIKFRNFFQVLSPSVTKLQINNVVFSVLFEMLRQNPNCDWFFKTSYIDIHSTQTIQATPYIYPDQATLITQAVLDLKPYRTKLRDEIVSYTPLIEDVNVNILESNTDKLTLIFDRVACDLTDENSWDTIPWDATAVYPETSVISLDFVGTGLQTCFIIPEIVPQGELVVTLNGYLAIPAVDYVIDPATPAICFTVAPAKYVVINVLIDSIYEYFTDFEYTFHGNSAQDSVVIPVLVAETAAGDIFSTWNGVHQFPVTDFIVQVTSDTEVVYNSIPTSEIEVNGTVFGGVTSNVFTTNAYVGDGSTTEFNTTIQNQDSDTVIVIIDGVWQTSGTAYAIDNVTFAPLSYVNFVIPPANDTNILIYAATEPDLTVCHNYNFTGDGINSFFSISNLNSTVPPKIFANIDGIQQNSDLGDFITNSNGIVFDIVPYIGANIAIFVVWAGLGRRLMPISYPETIQWDWAFWNYADLGRQEYDFAGFFVGDGITDSFTVPIPQSSSVLYNVVIKFFDNGVATTLNKLGLTMTLTKLSTGVVVFLSDPLPTTVYGALYLSRGFYEGLEPTFGYQDPNGIVFAPEPSSYQHFFARLISATFDPSTVMAGCSDHTPEERIQSTVDDIFTIVVKINEEVQPSQNTTSLLGLHVTAEIGELVIESPLNSPHIIGVAAISHGGMFSITTNISLIGVGATVFFDPSINISPDISGLSVSSAVGVIESEVTLDNIHLIGIEVVSDIGSPSFEITTNPHVIGVAAVSHIGTPEILVLPSFVGQEVITAVGQPSPAYSIYNEMLVGLSVSAHIGTPLLAFTDNNILLSGVDAVSHIGSPLVVFPVQNIHLHGQTAITHAGSLTPSLDKMLRGMVAYAHAGHTGLLAYLTGVLATSHVGITDVDIPINKPHSPSVSSASDVGVFSVEFPINQPDLVGLEASSDIGILIAGPAIIGLESATAVGSFSIEFPISEPSMIGQDSFALVGTFSLEFPINQPDFVGVVAASHAGIPTVTNKPHFTGVSAASAVGSPIVTNKPHFVGAEVVSHVGSLSINNDPHFVGVAAGSHVGTLIADNEPHFIGASTTSHAGVFVITV